VKNSDILHCRWEHANSHEILNKSQYVGGVAKVAATDARVYATKVNSRNIKYCHKKNI